MAILDEAVARKDAEDALYLKMSAIRLTISNMIGGFISIIGVYRLDGSRGCSGRPAICFRQKGCSDHGFRPTSLSHK